MLAVASATNVMHSPATAGIGVPRFSAPPNARRLRIVGITVEGQAFRPSDWAERLAGVLSPFRPAGGAGAGAHIGYSPYCVPTVFDGARCVIVNDALRELEILAWDFVINFARDNALQVIEM